MATPNGTSNGVTPSLDFTTFHNIIDGKLEKTSQTRCGVNPSTLEELPPVPVSTAEDVDRAVKAAQKAAETWADVDMADRKKALAKFADAIEANAEDFATMVTKEQGKPLKFSRMEVFTSVGVIRESIKFELPEEVLQDTTERKAVVRYTPLGVAVGIVPWNFPVSTATTKLCLAVLSGNTFIMKPSPFTPYAGLKLVELAQNFFPPGVVQALSGDDDLGPWLTAHPGVDKVSFTGSTVTGKKVMESCSKTLKRVTLELGGNDPAIVCADVDVKAVAPKVAFMALFNSGQMCIAIKRVYIHESIYDDLMTEMVNYVTSLEMGDGLDEKMMLGPIQNKTQFEKVKNMLADVEANKFKVTQAATSATVTQKGYFVNPTIVEDLPEDSRLVTEEPFGPVFPVLKWKDETDVIRRANDTMYGLGASVWTRDDTQAQRIARKLKAGTVWINTHADGDPGFPFGGHKHSGIGVEGGILGLKSYCNAQVIGSRLSPTS